MSKKFKKTYKCDYFLQWLIDLICNIKIISDTTSEKERKALKRDTWESFFIFNICEFEKH